MATPDLVNGLFELFGGIFNFMNVKVLYRDKSIRGIHWLPTVIYTLWGFWNLYYYPHLGQILSFVGGIFVVTANFSWVSLLIYYSWRRGNERSKTN